ncbi:MAG: VanW family protein [Ardenticatenales bacterium]|nr:VanW family protein [Ardenticatenales bacterium]
MAQSVRPLSYQPVPHKGWPIGRLLAWLLSWLVGLLILAVALGWHYSASYEGRIFAGVRVNGVPLEGLTPEQATAVLQTRLSASEGEGFLLQAAGERWSVTRQELGIRLDAALTAQAAYQRGREGMLTTQWLQRLALWRGSDTGQVDLSYTRDPMAVDALLTRIANQIARDPQDAALYVQGLTMSSRPAQPGRQLDIDASREQLLTALAANEPNIALTVVERAPHIVGADEAARKARALLSTPLALYFDQPEYQSQDNAAVPTSVRRQWMVDRTQLAEMLLIFSNPTENGQYALDVRLKPELLRDELESIAATITREPRDARFDYDPNSGILTPLVISQDGLKMDVEASLAAVQEVLKEGRHEISLTVATIPPKVATADAPKFNIAGLAVQGFSDYTGSMDEREINLSVAAQQYNGIVIAPGAEFSFNEYLGWVVDANGYEEGYIIAGNKTEVDVGGGVCQVSTTVFRAAFYAGFEIVERHAHAYRVPYYENGTPMGFDATIFSPHVDLKFRNNTENYYLMEVENNRTANTLAVNLYGPPLGRKVSMSATVLSTVPAGAPVYENDPTLSAGVTKQVDWAHPGATVRIDRVIRDDAGNVISSDVFWSKFRPWQDRFLVGTGGQ